MELEIKSIEKRLICNQGIIYRTIGTKLTIESAKLVEQYENWKKF